eukprot:402611-Pelagomonas_calceolata.AAC.2
MLVHLFRKQVAWSLKQKGLHSQKQLTGGPDASSRCEQFSSAVKAGLAQPSRLRGLTGFSRVKEYGQSAYVGWLEAEEQSEDVQVERGGAWIGRLHKMVASRGARKTDLFVSFKGRSAGQIISWVSEPLVDYSRIA